MFKLITTTSLLCNKMLASTEPWIVGKLGNSCYPAIIVHPGKFWLQMKGHNDWLVGWLPSLWAGWLIDGLTLPEITVGPTRPNFQNVRPISHYDRTR